MSFDVILCKTLAQSKTNHYHCNNRCRHASHQNSEPGRNFCFLPLMTTSYTKEPLSVKSQIELLKSLELASIGTLSKFYYNFGDIRAKKLVARSFNLPQHKVLETTITLFSNLRFKGVGRHPKTWKKKGGIKVHTNIHANEGVPSDIRFTSAATNDSFMLKPTNYNDGDIIAMGRDYIDYSKFEELTNRGVIYVTKMKKKPKVISLLTNDISKKSTFA